MWRRFCRKFGVGNDLSIAEKNRLLEKCEAVILDFNVDTKEEGFDRDDFEQNKVVL